MPAKAPLSTVPLALVGQGRLELHGLVGEFSRPLVPEGVPPPLSPSLGGVSYA